MVPKLYPLNMYKRDDQQYKDVFCVQYVPAPVAECHRYLGDCLICFKDSQ